MGRAGWCAGLATAALVAVLAVAVVDWRERGDEEHRAPPSLRAIVRRSDSAVGRRRSDAPVWAAARDHGSRVRRSLVM